MDIPKGPQNHAYLGYCDDLAAKADPGLFHSALFFGI